MAKEMMKAVGFYKYLPINDPESLLDVEIEKPVPGGKDLLVKVKAISVNPVDVKVRSPKNRTEQTPRVIGWDVAGIVEQVGPETTLFQPGDEVYYAGSIVRAGGNSEFHLVDERIVGRKPASLGFAEAAALPLTGITAWEGLFHRLGISPNAGDNAGKSLLVIGAAGGVGSIATQLAKLAGLTVIGTASRPESADWAKQMGADHIINHYEAFVPQFQKIGIKHADYIFCLNSTEKHWGNMAEAIAPQGKICSIVETDELLNLTLLQDKSATFVWELMFTRPMFQTEDMIEQHKLLSELSRLVDKGKIRTTIAEKLEPINAANLRQAHAMVETGRTIGKIVLENFS
ncbi:zinc-binding alcohol dehydrogenase family protein [Paenibacillus macerans]|nr:zinc-binding alcohol dehydrogenase family protein [Paenibacillus macerans]MBS5912443.1 zinc-binding alcohol dehydrogenase family protein [Paenibacillus macerans]MCY7559110.1 zinc-binding alcohol dehydrogenase family protein [Paenibacillus macerans]MEC0152548.1 zinc-binding alcohol dehydrogenase family protein [Paenibacillus macerans]UMV48263.1 zinc-binding alcohol dehydrogenase family protein [Paenibacillus macerans]SUD25766.1 alginate lyase [Paenibacillus macerans]